MGPRSDCRTAASGYPRQAVKSRGVKTRGVPVWLMLCAAAAKLGADAVVVVYDRVQPTAAYVSGPWWGRSIETISGRKVVGVAIRYKR